MSSPPALPPRGWSPSTLWSSLIHRQPSWWELLQRTHCPSPTGTQKTRHLQSSFKKNPTQTYTHIGRQVIKCSKSYNFRTGTRSTYRSLYWSKALLASTSSFLRRTEGIAPSSIGGSYLLLHGDLMDKEGQSVELYKEIYRTRSVMYCAGDLVQKRHWVTQDKTQYKANWSHAIISKVRKS